MADEATARVIDLIRKLAPHSSAVIQPKTPLLESGLLDSLMIIALIEELEKHFGVRLATEDLTSENFSDPYSITALLGRSAVTPAR